MSFAAEFAGNTGFGTARGSDADDCGVYVNAQTDILTMGRRQVQLSKSESAFIGFMIFSPLLFPAGVTDEKLKEQFGDDAIAMVDGLRERLKEVSIANDGGDGGSRDFNEAGQSVHIPTFHEYTITADMLIEPMEGGYLYRGDLAALIDATHEISEENLDSLRLKAPASVFTLSF